MLKSEKKKIVITITGNKELRASLLSLKLIYPSSVSQILERKKIKNKFI